MGAHAILHGFWELGTAPLAWAMLACGALTLVALLVGPVAPYGRYSAATGWGPLIGSKLAWVTQEIPSFLIPAAWLLLWATPEQRARAAAPGNAALLATFLLHYFYRDLVFPFRLRGGKPTPLVVWAMALAFCVFNGYMQSRYLLDEAPVDAALTPRVVAGIAVWALGWCVNLHADHVLINLRKPGEQGYKIPRGGMFEYVSAANYFGEIVEWGGWALASASLPAAAFSLFTFANLAPRGWRHHLWYRQRFPRYPRHRRAVLPFVW